MFAYIPDLLISMWPLTNAFYRFLNHQPIYLHFSLCLWACIINTVVCCCCCSALCGQPRFCMINYLRLYFWAPCAFSTQHPWVAFSTDSPGTWMRVRNLSFSARKSFQMRDDRGRLKAFWCLALSHIGSLFFSLHSWCASGYASRNAAPECDARAVLSGSGRRSVSVVPVLHYSFRGIPLHCQPNLQVWSIRLFLKETDCAKVLGYQQLLAKF